MSLIDRLRDLPHRLNAAVDHWLTAPAMNAAGRMGLFRIIYGLFYLWAIVSVDYSAIGQTSQAGWHPIVIDRFIRAVPPVIVLQTLELLLITSLILLIIGYRVRLATVLVLLTGITLESFIYSFGKVDHASLFLSLYIPLFMSIGHWGATYSLDATLAARRTGKRVDASDSSWRYIWPMRAVLLILGVLFFSAFYWKTTHGTWDSNPSTLYNLIMSTNMGIQLEGGSVSPLVPLLTRAPLLVTLMQVGTMAFESLFFLSLFNRTLRNWFLALAVLFHAGNIVLISVSFTAQLIAYLLFVDWQAWYARWISPYLPRVRFDGLPTPVWSGGALVIALGFALIWLAFPAAHGIVSLGGLLSKNLVWTAASVIAVIVWLRSSVILLSSLLTRRAYTRQPTAST